MRTYVLVALICMLLGFHATAHVAGAFNDWQGEYHKWPWRAGAEHYHSRISHPGVGSTHQFAIDTPMSVGTPIHSIGPGTVHSYANIDCAGNTLIVSDMDGTYITYMHLSAAFGTAPQAPKVQGQLVALSGNSGSEDNVPGVRTCSSGPHLHFQRNAGPNSGTPLQFDPISGVAYSQMQAGILYKSDNAGIGDVCTSGDQGPGWSCTESSPILRFHYGPFVNAFNSQGGYNGPGVPWDPCGGGNAGCWWVHTWQNAFTGRNDATQDFKGGPNQGTGAIMRRQQGCSGCWWPDAYWIHGDIWQKYLALGGAGWPGLGYPASNEIPGNNSRSGTPFRQTRFQAGTIVWWATTAAEYEVHGAIWLTYDGMGGPHTSRCGLPTQDEVPWGPGGAISLFQYGYIYWTGSSAQVGCP